MNSMFRRQDTAIVQFRRQSHEPRLKDELGAIGQYPMMFIHYFVDWGWQDELKKCFKKFQNDAISSIFFKFLC